MTILNIHFEKEVTDTLKPICERIIEEYSMVITNSTMSLTGIEKYYPEIKEQLKSSKNAIKYFKVEDLQVDIKAKRKHEYDPSPNIYVSSSIKANLISESYLCLAILENHVVCVQKEGDEILFIAKNGYKIIFDSFR